MSRYRLRSRSTTGLEKRPILAAGYYLSSEDSLSISSDLALRVLDRRGQVIIDARRVLPPLASAVDWDLYPALKGAGDGLLYGRGLASGADSIVAFADEPVAGWTIVLEHPAKEVFAAADAVFVRQAGAVLIFFLSTAVVLLVLDARIRMRQLSAERAVASRNEFVERLVHDLRTPLTVSKAAAMLVERRTGDAQAEALATLRDALTRLESMLTELADPRGESLTVTPEWFEGRQVIVRVAEQQRVLDPDLVISVHVVSESTGSSTVFWDECLFVRGLENLISNAQVQPPRVPHRGRGAFRCIRRVGLRGGPWSRHSRIRPAHVFEAFHRAANVQGVPGLGLGLANVAAIVRLHGGTVDIVSREGNGTKVTMRLPCSPGRPPTSPVAVVEQHIQSQPQDEGSP